MKYVWIVIAIVLLVRIDVILGLFEKASKKFQSNTENIRPNEIKSDREVVSFSDDKILKLTPRKKFLAFLNDFHAGPLKEVRELAIAQLKGNPNMFSNVRDGEFENAIYSWRDLVLQKNPETALFLIDLMEILKGENLDMVMKFSSAMIDVDVNYFLTYYSKSKDPSCSIAQLFADEALIEEKLTILGEREKGLDSVLASDIVDISIKNIANTCLSVVKLAINQLSPNQPVLDPESP